MDNLEERSNFSDQRKRLVLSLKLQNILKSEAVESALLKVRREDFAWDDGSKHLAYFDEPLPLGDTGQTVSAPHMVAIMLEELKLRPCLKVLEVGTGTGYNACLLATIVSVNCENASELVTTLERDERLAIAARRNIDRAGLNDEVKVIEGDGSLGYPPRSTEETYDRIIVTAGAPAVPRYLDKQLKVGGILLIPVGKLPYQTLIRITKCSAENKTGKENYKLKCEKLTACMFVPLVGEDAFRF